MDTAEQPQEEMGTYKIPRKKRPPPRAIRKVRLGLRQRLDQLPTRREDSEESAAQYRHYFDACVACGFRCPDAECDFVRNEVPAEGLPLEQMRKPDQGDKDSFFRHLEVAHFVGEGRQTVSMPCCEDGCDQVWIGTVGKGDIKDHLSKVHKVRSELVEAKASHVLGQIVKRPMTRTLTGPEMAYTWRAAFIARENVANLHRVERLTGDDWDFYQAKQAEVKREVAREVEKYGASMDRPDARSALEDTAWLKIMSTLEQSSSEDFQLLKMFRQMDKAEADLSYEKAPPQPSVEGPTRVSGKATGKGRRDRGGRRQTRSSKGSKESLASDEEECAAEEPSSQETYKTVVSKRVRSRSRGAAAEAKRQRRQPSPEPKSTPMDKRREDEEKRRLSAPEKARLKLDGIRGRTQRTEDRESTGRKENAAYTAGWDIQKACMSASNASVTPFRMMDDEKRLQQKGTPSGPTEWLDAQLENLVTYLDHLTLKVTPVLERRLIRDRLEKEHKQSSLIPALRAFVNVRNSLEPAGEKGAAPTGAPKSQTPQTTAPAATVTQAKVLPGATKDAPCPRCAFPGPLSPAIQEKLRSQLVEGGGARPKQPPSAALGSAPYPPPTAGVRVPAPDNLGASYSSVLGGHARPSYSPLQPLQQQQQQRPAESLGFTHRSRAEREAMFEPAVSARDRPFQPGTSEGWTPGEPADERRRRSVMGFAPMDFVYRMIRSKEEELKWLHSHVRVNSVYAQPWLIDRYLETSEDQAVALNRFYAEQAGSSQFSFRPPPPPTREGDGDLD